MRSSDQLDKIIPALVKAQAAVEVVPKTASNPHYKSMYQTFDMVMAAIKPHLTANGLAITFGTEHGSPHGADYTTTLWHASGQWISEAVFLPFDKLTPQGGVSALTYGSRRGAAAMLAIVADEDDDGNMASGKTVTQALAGTHQGERAPAPRPTKPNGQPPRAKGGAADKLMPFGKYKGMALGELPADELHRTAAWCREKDATKFKDLIAACEGVAAMKEFGEVPEPIAAGNAQDEDLPF